jgi:Base plate wedge protein 53
MSYFSKFPLTLMTIDQRPTIVTDILRRIAVGARFNDASALLLPYFVSDGETPEMVSNKVYGSPFYHWVVLHSNNIVDPWNEWPTENRYVVGLIFEKYDFVIGTDTPEAYTVDDTIGAYDDGLFTSAYSVTKVNVDTVQLRSITGFANIAVSTILRNLSTEQITGVEVHLRVSSVIDPNEAIHHYIDRSNGYIVDYDALNPDIEPVTNYDYEQTTNDNKRTVRVLDPKFLGDFVRSFEQLVSV